MSGARDPLRYFRVEAREISDALERGVLDLEKEMAPDLVGRMLRLAHTLKGAAGVVKQRAIAERTHALEDALSPFRDQEGDIPKDAFDGILAHVDAIAALVAELEPRKSGDSGPAQRAVLDEASTVLRGGAAEMDALLDAISEAGVQMRAMRHTVELAVRARRLADRLVDGKASFRAKEAASVSDAAAFKTSAVAEELRGVIATMEQALKSGIDLAEREMQQARTAAERLRLLPCSVVLASLERAARDAAQSLKKQVSFSFKGDDVRLDAQVLSLVQRALLQLVRNAVVHGIETGEDRANAGKPPVGHVELEVVRRGNRVAFICRDDGRGVDLDAVRKVLRGGGLSAPEVQAMEANDLLALLLKGGVTTSGVITELSGRGIGLDIVREVASHLGGEVSARTTSKGTGIELVVPVSLSSVEALLVETAGAVFAMPLGAVRGSLRLAAGDIARTADGASIAHDGKVITFAPLSGALKGRTPVRITGNHSAVLVEGSAALAAIGVDRLLGASEIVVRPLPAGAFADPMVAGVSLDAEGIPRLVLDPQGLVAAALRTGGLSRDAAAVPLAPILIIDDSLTTRVLEQSILESAGYEVELATSAEEALEKVKHRRYALFLVDVEMPGMDGFSFVERTRADPDLRAIPAILVTSRNSPEDQRRGIDVGARAYVIKGEFDQGQVLETIRELLERS